jgi:hypothetical protein
VRKARDPTEIQDLVTDSSYKFNRISYKFNRPPVASGIADCTGGQSTRFPFPQLRVISTINATGGKAIRTRSSVETETGKKRGPQGRAAKQGRKRKAGVVIKGN